MGSLYYSNNDLRPFIRGFYACIKPTLWEAIELAKRLQKEYSEIYLEDPAFHHHLQECNIPRMLFPKFLRPITSEATIERIGRIPSNKKRAYIFFNEKVMARSTESVDCYMMINMAEILQKIDTGTVIWDSLSWD